MRYHVCQFSDKTDNFGFLGLNLPKNGLWGQHFKNLSLDSESASLRYHVYQFSDKTDNFEFCEPNLPKTGFWGQNFKKLNLDSESASLRYYLIGEKKAALNWTSLNFNPVKIWSQSAKFGHFSPTKFLKIFLGYISNFLDEFYFHTKQKLTRYNYI